MAVNKVIANGETLIDLTEDSVSPQTLLKDYTAHNASGEKIVGERDFINRQSLAIGPSPVDYMGWVRIASITYNGYINGSLSISSSWYYNPPSMINGILTSHYVSPSNFPCRFNILNAVGSSVIAKVRFVFTTTDAWLDIYYGTTTFNNLYVTYTDLDSITKNGTTFGYVSSEEGNWIKDPIINEGEVVHTYDISYVNN